MLRPTFRREAMKVAQATSLFDLDARNAKGSKPQSKVVHFAGCLCGVYPRGPVGLFEWLGLSFGRSHSTPVALLAVFTRDLACEPWPMFNAVSIGTI